MNHCENDECLYINSILHECEAPKSVRESCPLLNQIKVYAENVGK